MLFTAVGQPHAAVFLTNYTPQEEEFVRNAVQTARIRRDGGILHPKTEWRLPGNKEHMS